MAKERRIIPVQSEFQANQFKTIETALFFAQVVKEKMQDPEDNRVFLGREGEGITILPAEEELVKIAKGVAKGAYNEVSYELVTDEFGNTRRVKNVEMQNVAHEIMRKVDNHGT